MMKRNYIFRSIALVIMGLFCMQQGSAETVSQKQASTIAEQFFNAANGRVMAAPKMVWNGRRLTTDRLFNPFYVYNHPAGGFVIISAENKAFPILAYSKTDSFDPNNIGLKLKTLLTLYANHIERIRYDSNVPEKAVNAWGNINQYIADVLSAPYDATDILLEPDQVESMIDIAVESEKVDSLVSAFYSADQWQQMVIDQLGKKQNVVVGLISPSEITGIIIHGRSGDYFRMDLDGQNRALFRLLPTEVLTQGELAVLDDPLGFPDEEEEELPFKFYDDFIAETRAEKEAEQLRIEEELIPTDVVVETIGAGHYMIRLPQNVATAKLYNIAGASLFTKKYRNTNVAQVDISTEPAGFYICLLEDESGNPYTVKLFR